MDSASSCVVDFLPTNNLVGPLLTDLYELTMAYAYWKVEPSLASISILLFVGLARESI